MKEKPYQTGLFGILSHLADLMILNILTLICCIPLVTAGAAMTALYTMTMRMARNEEGSIVREYFQAFRHLASFPSGAKILITSSLSRQGSDPLVDIKGV